MTITTKQAFDIIDLALVYNNYDTDEVYVYDGDGDPSLWAENELINSFDLGNCSWEIKDNKLIATLGDKVIFEGTVWLKPSSEQDILTHIA